MAFHVRDPETDALVRTLARRHEIGLTDAIKLAAREALASEEAQADARVARMEALSREVALWPESGLQADKAFYDSLNDEAD